LIIKVVNNISASLQLILASNPSVVWPCLIFKFKTNSPKITKITQKTTVKIFSNLEMINSGGNLYEAANEK